MKVMQLRKAKGLTQANLADLSGMTQQAIARLENGSVDPRLSTLRRIADALGCEMPHLFYSREEFLSEIQTVAREHRLDLSHLSMLKFNTICAAGRNVPSFHPYWEEVIFEAGAIKFKHQGGSKDGRSS